MNHSKKKPKSDSRAALGLKGIIERKRGEGKYNEFLRTRDLKVWEQAVILNVRPQTIYNWRRWHDEEQGESPTP